jgi:hypothetical protein
MILDHGKFTERRTKDGTRYFSGKGANCGTIIFTPKGTVRVYANEAGILASALGQGNHSHPVTGKDSGVPIITRDADLINQLQCLNANELPEDCRGKDATRLLEIFAPIVFPLLKAAIHGDSKPFHDMGSMIEMISRLRSGETSLDHGSVTPESTQRVCEVIRELSFACDIPAPAALVRSRLESSEKGKPVNIRRRADDWRHVLKSIGFDWLPTKGWKPKI